MTNKKNLLFVSNLFPNLLDLNMASFNRQQIQALSHYFNIDVVAPVSWQAKIKQRPFPSLYHLGTIECHHPTYFYTPGVARNLYGQFFLRSISSCVDHLLKKKQYAAIYGSWLYPDGWACAKLANHFNLPLFLKVHGTDVNQLTPGSSMTKKSIWAVAQAKKVFCVSQALSNRLVELGADNHKLQVLYNGVDTNIFHSIKQSEARTALAIDHDEPIILYVGNLKTTKGLHELAEAFSLIQRNKKNPSCRLVIVGQGPYESRLRAEVKHLNISSKTCFLGSLSLEKIALWMNTANLLCLPSYMEGIPNVLLEAFACKLPVVATSVGGIPELKHTGNTLKLVPPRDVAALANAIVSSLDCQPDYIKKPRIVSWQDNASMLFSCMGKYI